MCHFQLSTKTQQAREKLSSMQQRNPPNLAPFPLHSPIDKRMQWESECSAPFKFYIASQYQNGERALSGRNLSSSHEIPNLVQYLVSSIPDRVSAAAKTTLCIEA